MCGGEKFFFFFSFSTYDPPRKLQWYWTDLDLLVVPASTNGCSRYIYGCLNLSSGCCVVGVNRSRSLRRCSGSTIDLGPYFKSKLEQKLNSSEILPVNCICDATPT